ncbi:hypothetical protein TNCV_4082911 [Trichonephila clavipes]|nr:hypothetical protein TNCV_4082911 [Trichonephila clavipes]
MYLGLEVERPRLRRSFLIGGLEGARMCVYGDFFGDIRCDGNFFRVSGRETRLLFAEKNQSIRCLEVMEQKLIGKKCLPVWVAD